MSIAILAAAAMSACTPSPQPGSYPGPSPYPTSAPDALPSLDWQTWIDGRDVYVELADPAGYYETVTMDLVAPDGQRIPARSVTREEHVYRDGYGYGRPSVGVGGFGGTRGAGMGVGVSVPLGGSRPTAAYRDRDRRIVGRFTVPDMYQYSQTASRWHIEVKLTSRSGEASRAEIPAPLP